MKRTREGRVGVVEEDAERRQARAPGAVLDQYLSIVEPLKV